MKNCSAGLGAIHAHGQQSLDASGFSVVPREFGLEFSDEGSPGVPRRGLHEESPNLRFATDVANLYFILFRQFALEWG
jgi:hypothetical protein